MHYTIRIAVELGVDCPEGVNIEELIDKLEINPVIEGHSDAIDSESIEDVDWDED